MNSKADNDKVLFQDLIHKYNERIEQNSAAPVWVRISKYYSDYFNSNHGNIMNWIQITERLKKYESKGFIKLKFTGSTKDQIEKVYLNKNCVTDIEEYMASTWEIDTMGTFGIRVEKLVKEYQDENIDFLNFYCIMILDKRNSVHYTDGFDFDYERNMLDTIKFLCTNNEPLYIKEASCLIFGKAKTLEGEKYSGDSSEQTNYLMDVFEQYKIFIDNTELSLNEFYNAFNLIKPSGQIQLKGNIFIYFKNKNVVDISLFKQFILSADEYENIDRIQVKSISFMTVENLTSFLRINEDDTSYMYLGGFATKEQILFLRMIISQNENLAFYHFGDIDIGGFNIHKSLCEQTKKNFIMYHMNYMDIQNCREFNCELKYQEFTDKDNDRSVSLYTGDYEQTIDFMRKNKIKIEQEMISYLLHKENKGEFKL